MLKNKFLLIMAFCFLGVACTDDRSEEEEISVTQRLKTFCASSSPVVVGLTTYVFANIYASLLGQVPVYLPKEFKGYFNVDESGGEPLLQFLIPALRFGKDFFASIGAGYTSKKIFNDSSVNQNARLLGGLFYMMQASINNKIDLYTKSLNDSRHVNEGLRGSGAVNTFSNDKTRNNFIHNIATKDDNYLDSDNE